MNFDTSQFQQRFNSWKQGKSYWKDIRNIDLSNQQNKYEESNPQLENEAMDYIEKLNQKNSLPQFRHGQDSIPGYITTFVNRAAAPLYRSMKRKGIYNPILFNNMLSQIAYESSYGRSDAARNLNNYGGIKGASKKYWRYKNIQDFTDGYTNIMIHNHPGALKTKNTQQYARSLKDSGYYEDTYEHYLSQLNGMKSVRRLGDAYLKGYAKPQIFIPKQQPINVINSTNNTMNAIDQQVTPSKSITKPYLDIPFKVNVSRDIPEYQSILPPVSQLLQNNMNDQHLINPTIYDTNQET